MTVLVTGGAGYIGSHMVWELLDAGESVVVLDRLSTGFEWAVAPEAKLVVGDVADRELVGQIIRENKVDAIIHFAGSIVVPESVADPLAYYENNTSKTRTLIETAVREGVPHFIFSSTAAVYGGAGLEPVREDGRLSPESPYGLSKLMSEWMLRDLAASSSLRFVVLRYFNVAGSDPECRIGHTSPQATLLVKVACQQAVGVRPSIAIFGSDYPTPDGTGVRDYIHVEDLADAHLRALDYLAAGGDSTTLNCGYGHGYSVREVLATVARVHGTPLVVNEAPRRAGDPPSLVAHARRVRDVLGWSPRFDDLEVIVRTQLEWEHRLLREPGLQRN